MTHYCLQLCCLYFMLAIQTFQEDLNSRPWFSHCFSASLSENVISNGTQHEIIRPVPRRFAVGSAGADLSVIDTAAQTHPQRTLINPFKPNEIPCNWTCNRHRWSHVFPTGPDGEILHPHYHKLSTDSNDTEVKLQKVPILKTLKGLWHTFLFSLWRVKTTLRINCPLRNNGPVLLFKAPSMLIRFCLTTLAFRCVSVLTNTLSVFIENTSIWKRS